MKDLLRLFFAAEGIPIWVDETPVLSKPEYRPWEIWLWLHNNFAASWAVVDDMPLLSCSGGSLFLPVDLSRQTQQPV